MKNLKNKKRLGSISILLLLVFIVGAAFAYGQGQLDINGAVTFTPPDLLVEWIDPVLTNQDWDDEDETMTAEIVEDDKGNDTIIEWAFTFEEARGEATLTAMAENTGTMDAEIESAKFDWVQHEDCEFTEAQFATIMAGLTATIEVDDDDFADVVLVGATTNTMTVTVTWDGSAIDDFFDADELADDNDDGVFVDAAGNEKTFTAVAQVTFEVVPAS